MAARAAPCLLLLWSLLAGARALRLSAAEEREAEVSNASAVVHHGAVQIRYPSARAPVDPSVLQAVYVACGAGSCDRGLEAISSFLAQAKLDGGKRPVLHLFVDEACAARIQKLQRSRPSLAAAAEMRTYIVSELHLSTSLNLYKQCASLRLSLPRLLPDLPKVLYMDTDTYVAGSLQSIWKMDPYLWAFAENDLTWYTGGRCPQNWEKYLPEGHRDLKSCAYGETGLNSGVMLLNQDTWRRLDMDQEVNYWVQKLTDGGRNPKVLMMGDQDILNILATLHEKDNYTSMLSCEMNSIWLNRYMCFYGMGDWASFHRTFPETPDNATLLSRNSRQPVVIHAKFNVNRAGRKCWVDLHKQLRDAVDKVSRGEEAAGARSLCEVAGGCDLS